jgi:hypothetical protein
LTNGEVGAIISKVAQKAIIPSKNCKKISKKLKNFCKRY